MRNKLILFLMLALFGSASFLRADEVVIGDGTATSYYTPYNSLWGYSFVEQVYLADEIGMAGTINSISFQMRDTDAAFTSEFDIFMKNVERTQFASGTDFESVTASNLVYSGSITFQPGWTTITLDTPFAYDGTSNLMIGVHEKTSGYSTRYFYYTSVANTVISGHSDSADPNPYDMSTYTGTTYTKENRANIMIDITPGGGGGGGTVSGELTVHDGTATNVYVPVYGFYADSYLKSEMVYPAAELADMNGATINSMKFYSATENVSWGAANFQVFIKEVADATISAFAGPGTVVYEGPLSIVANEMNVEFTNGYVYGGGNLLVGVYNTVKGSYVSATWNGETVDGASFQGYSYSDLASVTGYQRSFLPKTTFTYESPIPTNPVEITPNPVALGDRPTNGWMEPVVMRIHNGMENAITMTANMSNTSGINVFMMDEEITDEVLEPEEDLAVIIEVNPMATAGDYTEQLTLFYVENRDITFVPVTATVYDAVAPDIVEEAGTVTWTGDDFTDTPDPATLHANYKLNGMTEMKPDAVYAFYLDEDYRFNAIGGDDFIAVYNQADVDHLDDNIEPVLMGTSGIIDDEVLLAGYYYLVVASNNISDITIHRTEIPAPTAITYVDPSPANGATEVTAPDTLAWEGGLNATEYQVLFGTSPVNTDIAKDWTMIDEEYGTYIVSSLQSNTQYFWQINVRNSKGTVEGDRWGFTSTLTTPTNVTATPDQIFSDEVTLIKWKHNSGTMGNLDQTQIGSGTDTEGYFPTYNFYNYSLTEQIYTAEELGGTAGYINSISFHPTGAITRNLKVYLANTDKASFANGSDWVAMTADNLVYEGNVTMVANTWVTINFDEPFEYEGDNLILAVTDHTGTWSTAVNYSVFDATAQSINIYQDSAPYSALAPAGTGNVRNIKNQIIINKADGKGNANTRNFQHYNVYVDGLQQNADPIYEKQYYIGPLAYNMTGYTVAVTAVYNEGESSYEAPAAQTTLYVSGYGEFTGAVKDLISNQPIEGATVKFAGTDEFGNNVSYEGTTNANGVYNINNVKAGDYVGIATLDGMEPSISDPVTLAKEVTQIVDFTMHEVYVPVRSVVAEEMDSELARVRWSLIEDIPVPNPGGNTPTPPAGNVVVKLTAGDVWGDGSGYQMLLDNTHSLYGTTIPTSGALSTSCSGNDAIYAQFSDKIPTNADGNCSTSNIVINNTVEITIPAGTYDWCITNPTPGDRIWIAAANGNVGGRYDDYVFEAGNTYEFTVSMFGSNDGVNVTITGGKAMAQPKMNFDNSDVRVADAEYVVADKGTRHVQQYKVYRAAILTAGSELLNVEEIDTLTPYCIDTTYYPDTLYADFDWANCEPGLYQYGVSAIYPSPAKGGNRNEVVIGDPTATTTNSYLPTYSLYEYSLTQQIYTADEIGMAGTINTLTMWLKNNSSYARNINVYMKEADVVTFAGGNAWVSMEDSDMVASFTLANGISSPVETAIALNTPFSYSGNGSLVICFQDVTGSWSSGAASVVMTGNGNQAIYAYRDGTVYNPTTPGVSGYVTTNKSVIKLDITPGGGNDDPETAVVWSNVLPKDINTTVIVNAQVPDATAEGATVTFNNTYDNSTFMVTFDETGTDTITDFIKGNYTVTFALEGYTSDINGLEISIWEDKEITGVFDEILKPITTISATRSGYVNWDDIIPAGTRVAEYYMVKFEGAQYAETTDNFIQIDTALLTVGETYTVGVAVMYTSGISTWKDASFTYADCTAATQVEGLQATNEPGNTNVTLAWNGGTPAPPTPPTGDVVVKLTVGDVWGDGSGYQMLLDNTHSFFGTVIPATGALSTNCSGNESIYNQFSHKIPTNADGNCSTSNIVLNTTVEITIPAGTYDWCITNPTPGDRIWIAASNGNVGGRRDDYVFEAGHTYEFTVTRYGSNDGVDVTITGGKDNRGGNLSNTGVGFGAANNALTDDGNWYYYDNGVNADAIGTGGGQFYWGIMLPAGYYEGNRLTKVAAYDYMAMSGTASIYQGGTTAPAGSALGTVNVTFTGAQDFVEFEFAEPVELDPEQNVWVVFYNGSGATYPAAVCANTGDANGRWVSLDGSTWEDIASYDLDNTFMVRAYIESGSGPAPTALVPNKYNIFVDGVLVAATANTTYTYDATDFAEHEYIVVWVESDMLQSCIVEGQNWINYSAAPLGVAESMVSSSIYPNPTDGDIRINANNMVRISIVNALGQVVYDKPAQGNEAIINMAQFGNGVYMVNIATENGTSVKRVIVNK